MIAPNMDLMHSNAIISPCARYRYWLRRQFKEGTKCWLIFVMLNPSYADHYEDDATIRRCVRFGRDLGYLAIGVVNLFAARSHNPEFLAEMPDPMGPHNVQYLAAAMRLVARYKSSDLLLAWGSNKMATGPQSRDTRAWIREFSLDPMCLGMSKNGHPKHPLYLPALTEPEPYKWNEADGR
jgi:hypothetical protein